MEHLSGAYSCKQENIQFLVILLNQHNNIEYKLIWLKSNSINYNSSNYKKLINIFCFHDDIFTNTTWTFTSGKNWFHQFP